jgi:hypothetical protein
MKEEILPRYEKYNIRVAVVLVDQQNTTTLNECRLHHRDILVKLLQQLM